MYQASCINKKTGQVIWLWIWPHHQKLSNRWGDNRLSKHARPRLVLRIGKLEAELNAHGRAQISQVWSQTSNLLSSLLSRAYQWRGRHAWTQKESRPVWQTGRQSGRAGSTGPDRVPSCLKASGASSGYLWVVQSSPSAPAMRLSSQKLRLSTVRLCSF